MGIMLRFVVKPFLLKAMHTLANAVGTQQDLGCHLAATNARKLPQLKEVLLFVERLLWNCSPCIAWL